MGFFQALFVAFELCCGSVHPAFQGCCVVADFLDLALEIQSDGYGNFGQLNLYNFLVVENKRRVWEAARCSLFFHEQVLSVL